MPAFPSSSCSSPTNLYQHPHAALQQHTQPHGRLSFRTHATGAQTAVVEPEVVAATNTDSTTTSSYVQEAEYVDVPSAAPAVATDSSAAAATTTDGPSRDPEPSAPEPGTGTSTSTSPGSGGPKVGELDAGRFRLHPSVAFWQDLVVQPPPSSSG